MYVTYQFSDVKNVLAQKDSHAHFDWPLFFLISREFSSRCVGQELKWRFVEVLLILFATIVVWEDFVEGGVDLGVDVWLGLDLALYLIKDLQAVVMVAQVEPFFSLGDSAKVYGIFVRLKALLGFLQEVDRELDVSVLSRSEDCEHGILDRIELVRERLDASLVQGQ